MAILDRGLTVDVRHTHPKRVCWDCRSTVRRWNPQDTSFLGGIVTLIQTLLTPRFVIQVSDRRLTAGGELFDDTHNKAVSWCGCFVAGFTGFAFTDRAQTQPVSEWIAKTLAPLNDTSDAIDALKGGAEELVRKRRRWPDLRLSIVLAGIPFGYDFAYFVCISNYDDLTKACAKPVDPFVFNQRMISLSDTHTQYITVGANLNSQEKLRTEQLPRIAQLGGVNNAARYMVEIQRAVSARDATVGEDAMVVSIPVNPTAPGAMMTNLSSPDLTEVNANFSLMKAGGFAKERLGPHIAGGGWAWGEFMGKAGPGESQRVSARILRMPTTDEINPETTRNRSDVSGEGNA